MNLNNSLKYFILLLLLQSINTNFGLASVSNEIKQANQRADALANQETLAFKNQLLNFYKGKSSFPRFSTYEAKISTIDKKRRAEIEAAEKKLVKEMTEKSKTANKSVARSEQQPKFSLGSSSSKASDSGKLPEGATKIRRGTKDIDSTKVKDEVKF